MKKHVCFAIGLLMAILGLAIAVDTAFADGCCGGGGGAACPHYELVSCGTAPCYTPNLIERICSNAKTDNACSGDAFDFIEVKSFPSGTCEKTTNNTACNTTIEDCYRSTTCKWDKTVNPPACANDLGDDTWSPANKMHTDDCP